MGIMVGYFLPKLKQERMDGRTASKTITEIDQQTTEIEDIVLHEQLINQKNHFREIQIQADQNALLIAKMGFLSTVILAGQIVILTCLLKNRTKEEDLE